MSNSSKTPIYYVPPCSLLKFIRVVDVSNRKTKQGNHVQAKALYECECGNIKELFISAVKRGNTYGGTKSCGNCRFNVRGLKHGLSNNPLYKIYSGIRARCYNEKAGNYSNYGGKGVKMCEEWINNPQSFIDWAIENGWQEGLQIDKDKKAIEKGLKPLLYSPEMCSILSDKENKNNRLDNHILEYNGDKLTLTQMAEKYNLNSHTLNSRLNNGWDIQKALTTPIQKRIYTNRTNK